MENKNMFAVYSYDNMRLDETKFHGIAPRNWLARDAIMKLANDYKDRLDRRGISGVSVRLGHNETSISVVYGLHERAYYFELITIGEIKP